jgi:hypothetical protein
MDMQQSHRCTAVAVCNGLQKLGLSVDVSCSKLQKCEGFNLDISFVPSKVINGNKLGHDHITLFMQQEDHSLLQHQEAKVQVCPTYTPCQLYHIHAQQCVPVGADTFPSKAQKGATPPFQYLLA